MESIIVYTAITGGYDRLATDFEPEEGIRYRAYIDLSTNAGREPSEPWLPIQLDHHAHCVIRSRIRKALGPVFCMDEKPPDPITVYLDGSFAGLRGIREMVDWFVRCSAVNHPHWIGLFHHPEGPRSIEEEAKLVIGAGLDTLDNVDASLRWIRDQGLCLDTATEPVMAGGCMIRRFRTLPRGFVRDWLWHLENGTHRDQIFMPALLRKYNVGVVMYDGMRSGEHFVIREHARS